MPKWDITDSFTGDTLTIEADQAPSQDDVLDIFKQHGSRQVKTTPEEQQQLEKGVSQLRPIKLSPYEQQALQIGGKVIEPPMVDVGQLAQQIKSTGEAAGGLLEKGAEEALILPERLRQFTHPAAEEALQTSEEKLRGARAAAKEVLGSPLGIPALQPPSEDISGEGVGPTLRRFGYGMSTPVSLGLIAAAPESQLVKAAFTGQMGLDTAEAIAKLPEAQTADEIKGRLADVVLKGGMTALVGRGEPEKIVSAAYKDAEGKVHTGANHPEILESLGEEVGTRESRNNDQFGYWTDKNRFINRPQGAVVAKRAGQQLEPFDISKGKEQPHSDEIASPVEPDETLGNVPQPVQKDVQTKPYYDVQSEALGLGRPSTRPTVEDVRAQRAAEAKAKPPFDPNGLSEEEATQMREFGVFDEMGVFNKDRFDKFSKLDEGRKLLDKLERSGRIEQSEAVGLSAAQKARLQARVTRAKQEGVLEPVPETKPPEAAPKVPGATFDGVFEMGPKKMWQYTFRDLGDDPGQGMTFYVPEGTSLEAATKRANEKLSEFKSEHRVPEPDPALKDRQRYDELQAQIKANTAAVKAGSRPAREAFEANAALNKEIQQIKNRSFGGKTPEAYGREKAENLQSSVAPKPEAASTPAKPFFDVQSEGLGLGRPSTAPTVEDVRAQRAREATTTEKLSERAGDPKLWNLPDDEILSQIDNLGPREKLTAKQQESYDDLQQEARSRGLIKKTELEKQDEKQKPKEQLSAKPSEQVSGREQVGKPSGRKRVAGRKKSEAATTAEPTTGTVQPASTEAAAPELGEKLVDEITALQKERDQLAKQPYGMVDVRGTPVSAASVGNLARQRYIEGRIDALQALYDAWKAKLAGKKAKGGTWAEHTVEQLSAPKAETKPAAPKEPSAAAPVAEPITRQHLEPSVRDQIRNAPSFQKLLDAYKRFQRSLHGKSADMDVITKNALSEPEDLLTAHSGVMNAKSQMAKTLSALADAVFRETGLPRRPQGRFRGQDSIDWDKLVERASKVVPKPAVKPTAPKVIQPTPPTPPVEPPKPPQPPAAETTPAQPAGESQTYGIAEWVRDKRAKAGQVDPVDPGKGITPQETIEYGRSVLAKDPQAGVKALEAFEADPKKAISLESISVTRAHGEQLAKTAEKMREQHGTDSEQYRSARKELSDWDKRTKGMQTEWHKQGMAQQGETDIDTGSFTGLSRAYEEATGKEFTPKQEKEAEEIAGRKKKADKIAADAEGSLRKEISDRTTADRASMSTAERRAFDAANKTVREWAIRRAEAENKARVADEKLKQAVEKFEADVKSKSAKATTDQERAAAIRAARRENQGRVDAAKRAKEVADIQVQAAKRAGEVAEKTVRDAARRAAQKQAKDLAMDPHTRVLAKAREYIEQLGMDNLDDIRNKIATELGMKVSQVTKLLATAPKIKFMMDDVWNKKQVQRKLEQTAKRWLQEQEQPGWRQALTLVPRVLFGLKVGFHGTVALGTHAPAKAFDPRFWALYGENFAKMYRMVGAPTPKGQARARAYYEQQMQDMMRRPNYIVARRAGLQNDPFQYEEFADPTISAGAGTIRGAAGRISKPFAEAFNKMTDMGNRGYSVLKLLRQDMFDQHWNQLAKTLRYQGMAESVSDAVNHDTGVTKTKAPSGTEIALFAPRLEASRIAWLAVDPARAAATFANWKNASSADKWFAIEQVKSKALVAGTLYSLLSLNQGLLSATGSDQKVNFTDPFHADFLKFKVGGMNLAYGNPMLTMIRLPVRLWKIRQRESGKLKNLVYPDENTYSVLGEYGRSQLSPFASLTTTLWLKGDWQNRPLPGSEMPVPKRLRMQGVEPYTWPEFWAEQVAPIPVEEAMREVWKTGMGMKEDQYQEMRKAFATWSVMSATGARLNEDIPYSSEIPPGPIR